MNTSIKNRFAASVVANVLRSGISFSTGLLLARWLEPQDYGRMVFLLASFMAFRQFLDMGSSTAFFTLLSQRQRSARFVSIFWYWVGLQLFVSLALVYLVLPDSTIAQIWLGESRMLLILALLASFMQGTVWSIACQMAEASRETVRMQRLNTIVVLIHLCLVVLLWWLQQLAIPLIFVALTVEWGLAGWLAAKMYRGHAIRAITQENMDTVRSIWREYRSYCLPLIPFAWLGFAQNFGERWMLQHWGGAAEQAYYGVAQQFANIALLATTSILGIFWKEIAEAHHNGDLQRVEMLYGKVSRALYFVGAVIAGGLLPWTAEILQITLGTAYEGGTMTLMLMFLYPVHQSMGQIGGTMLFATGHVYLRVMLGGVFMVASLVAAYFMMAPADAAIPGFGMASQGLAWKMVLLQFLQVNALAWVIARLFKWRFDWVYQVMGLSACIGLGYFANFAATYILAGQLPLIVSMVFAGIFYACLIIALAYGFPGLAGLSRAEYVGYAHRLRTAVLPEARN